MTGNESKARPTDPRNSAEAQPAQAAPSDYAGWKDQALERADAPREIQRAQGEQQRGYADTPKGEMPQVPSDFQPPALDADGEPATPNDVPRAVRAGSDDSGDVAPSDTDVDSKAAMRSGGGTRRAT